MPNWLTIIGGITGVVAVFLTIYKIIDDKVGAKKKELDSLKEKLSDHETRLTNAERVTGVVEDVMEELLVENLKRRK